MPTSVTASLDKKVKNPHIDDWIQSFAWRYETGEENLLDHFAIGCSAWLICVYFIVLVVCFVLGWDKKVMVSATKFVMRWTICTGNSHMIWYQLTKGGGDIHMWLVVIRNRKHVSTLITCCLGVCTWFICVNLITCVDIIACVCSITCVIRFEVSWKYSASRQLNVLVSVSALEFPPKTAFS